MNRTQNTPTAGSVDTIEAIQRIVDIAQTYIRNESTTPVNPFRTPTALDDVLDLDITDSAQSNERVMEAIEGLVNATPRSTSTRFYNQLFSGRDPIATAADMLVPVLNTSLYTFKAAGPMAMVEQIIIRHMAGLIGFEHDGANSEGVFTPGGSISNLVAMLIGRNEAVPNGRNGGLCGVGLTCYASDRAHYSIMKNAGILGIGRDFCRRIRTNLPGALDPRALRQAIVADLEDGFLPSSIIATAGTTVQGAFDPIGEIADIADEFGIWLHVDASFGGGMLLSPTHRTLLAGIERGDSVAWNVHKVMGVPLSAAALITRKRGYLRKNLDETADYLFQGDEDELNPGTRSIQCGRRNDALKVWAAWKHAGDSGYRTRIEKLINIAQYAANQIQKDDRFTLACDPAYVNVCFEVNGKSSRAICELLRERQELLVGHASVGGRRIIRVPFVNNMLTTHDVDEMLELILRASDLLPSGDNAEPG